MYANSFVTPQNITKGAITVLSGLIRPVTVPIPQEAVTEIVAAVTEADFWAAVPDLRQPPELPLAFS